MSILVVALLMLSKMYYYGIFSMPAISKNIAEIPVEANARVEEMHIPEITLERIFDPQQKLTNLPPSKIRTVMVTGDVLLARSVNAKTVVTQNFIWPFEQVSNVLQGADVAYINLETPLVKNCPVTHEGMTFCGDERNVHGILYAGIDVVNFANNHAGNYGVDGIVNTVRVLEENGLSVAGVDGPVIKDVRGIKMAFLGYSEFYQEGVRYADVDVIRNEIMLSKQNAEIVIVQFHWGNEYTTDISPKQKELARTAINAGADLVIGNHPHWIQPAEIYNGRLIVYSHGNFIFDQEWSLKTKTGIVGKYTFFDDKLVSAEFLPVQIDNYGQPRFLTDERRFIVLKDMEKESFNFSLQD